MYICIGKNVCVSNAHTSAHSKIRFCFYLSVGIPIPLLHLYLSYTYINLYLHAAQERVHMQQQAKLLLSHQIYEHDGAVVTNRSVIV